MSTDGTDEMDELPPDLAALIGGLPTEIEPDRDLWEGVEAAVAPVPLPLRAARRSWMPLALAAATLLGALAAWSMRPVAPGDVREETTQAAVRWEDDVRATTDELEAVLERRRSELDPQALAVIERALADIDAAIADVHRALAADPGNDALAAALADVWQRKVHLLRNAAELAEAG
ncbi:MAG: hypothetical protein KC656_01100 [Myxococcales bacterium]|nr:hypothetical protein [Myxococcales bacterium]